MKWLPWAILGVSVVLNLILVIHPQSRENNDKNFPFLSKRIFAENQNDILINFIPLRTVMREYVEEISDPIGVYFEFLPSGTSIGVNDRDEYAIASLIKTPLVMASYRQIEKGVLKKEDTIEMTEKLINKGFGTLWQRGVGTKITVAELISIVLKESDNTASAMLRSVVPEEELKKVFDGLDINTDQGQEILTISPKSYSSIMRSLYLSSYLERESSNEILNILTQTNFKDKIEAGIPEGIPVAHKIGIWDLDSKNGSGIVYNDCGIIYAPGRPYLLCIMTKSTEAKAQEHMSKISRMVYSYVSKVKKADY